MQKQFLIIFFVIIFLFAVFGVAGNSKAEITSVSGTVSDGESVTISGSGFGTKATPAPIKWDNFENGVTGESIEGWVHSGSDHAVYSSDVFYSGTKSAYCDFSNPTYNRGFYINDSLTNIYIYFKHRWNSTGVTTRQFKIWDFNGWSPCTDVFLGETYQVSTNWQSVINNHGLNNENIPEEGPNTWNAYEMYAERGTADIPDGLVKLWHDSNLVLNQLGIINYDSADSCPTYETIRFGMFYAHDPGGDGNVW